MSVPFSFPPPPPPPPRAAPDQGFADQYPNHGHGGRGGRGGFRGGNRGRGNNGNNQRGSAGGGYSAQQYQGNPGSAAFQQHSPMTGPPAYASNYPQQPQNYAQQPWQQQAQANFYQMHSQSPSFSPSQAPYTYPNQSYGQTPYAANAQTAYASNGQYQNQAGYGIPQQAWPQPMQQPQGVPQIMGPPIRLGFELGQTQNPASFQVPQQGRPSFDNKRKRDNNSDSRGTSNNARIQGGNNAKSRPQKKPRVETAPAVPSFGGPLPSQVPPESLKSNDASNAGKKKKKKRKTNQLGLTPAGEEHESSEEEVDEEALFAATGGPLQFEYRGKKSTLRSSADIAAWIEERKKRWPTKARVDAREAELQQRRQEQAEARKKAYEAQAEARRKVQEAQAQAKKASEEAETQSQAGAAELSLGTRSEKKKKERSYDEKTKQALERHLAKAEKLRKKLDKSQARAEKLAVGLQQPPSDGAPHVQSDEKVDLDDGGVALTKESQIIGTGGGAVMTEGGAAQGANEVAKTAAILQDANTDIPEGPLEALEAALNATLDTPVESSSNPSTVTPANLQSNVRIDHHHDNASATHSNISASDSDSSTSSSSDSESDSSSDSSPEETSTKTSGPIRVPPPKREAAGSSARVCRFFLSKGHCKQGEACKFKHQLPERGVARKEKKEKQPPGKEKEKVRKTLYQRLVEQEQAEEDKVVLKAIKFLGQSGLLQGKVY